MSYGPIGWILPSEVFPLSMRSKGVALATASNWFNNCTHCILSFVFVPTFRLTTRALSSDRSSDADVYGAFPFVRIFAAKHTVGDNELIRAGV